MSDYARALAAQPPRLVAREHTAFDGIPYFDHDLGVAQSMAHRVMAVETSAVLAAVAREAGLAHLSDEPIWCLHPESDEQRVFYGDCVMAKAVDTRRIIADDLLLVIEVVSTNDRRKELKDRRFQRLLNEYNGVPEFALAFPELEDPRALTWCRLSDGMYEEHAVGPGGRVASSTVPGLEFRVLPKAEWTLGYKVDVYYRGQLRPRLLGERARAEEERVRAEEERARAEEERARAEAERARADAASARAAEERARAEAASARAERLAARLRALGVDVSADSDDG